MKQVYHFLGTLQAILVSNSLILSMLILLVLQVAIFITLIALIVMQIVQVIFILMQPSIVEDAVVDVLNVLGQPIINVGYLAILQFKTEFLMVLHVYANLCIILIMVLMYVLTAPILA